MNGHHRPKPAAFLLVPVLSRSSSRCSPGRAPSSEPRDLPIGVAGPAAATRSDRAAAWPHAASAFDVHRYADEAAAREAIEDREVYGAFVATPGGPKVLTASAASPAVAQLLTHAAAESRRGAVEDVVPAAARAAALASSVLPLVLAGILTGVAGVAARAGALRRAGLLVGGSVLAGLAATAIVQSWLDVVGGDWVANAAVLEPDGRGDRRARSPAWRRCSARPGSRSGR